MKEHVTQRSAVAQGCVFEQQLYDTEVWLQTKKIYNITRLILFNICCTRVVYHYSEPAVDLQ